MTPSVRVEGRATSPRPPVLAGLLLALAACGGEARPPSALLVTLDTTRTDALGAFEGPEGLTPAVDGLAEEGVVFLAARAVAPLTLPAHASMLTGLYPPRHGVRDNSVHVLPPAATTLAELARASGRRTAAFVASLMLDPAFGLDQGFETYRAPPRPADDAPGYGELPAEAVADAAVAWLEALGEDEAFLLWVHLYDPHAPYEPPPDALRAAAGDAYRGEVAAADRAVGRVLDALARTGRLGDTAVVVASDHGEGLGERGERTHGSYVFDATIRAPMLVRLPGWAADGRPEGGRSSALASAVDVLPTLADALGLAVPPGLDGRSLLAPVPPERGVYFESYHGHLAFGWAPLAGWASAEGTYVHAPTPLAFDGPLGTGAARAPTEAEARRARAAIAAVADAPALERGATHDDAALLDAVRGIGYAASGAAAVDALPHPLADTGLPDPHERMEELDRTWRAVALGRAGAVDEAVAELRALVAANPRNVFALDRLGDLLVRAGRHEEALEPLERLVAVGRPWAGSHHALGLALLRLGRPAEAEARFRDAVALDAGHAPSLRELARRAAARGDEHAAAAWRARLERAAAGGR